MHAWRGVCNVVGHEEHRHTSGVGAAAASRRAARVGGVLQRGSRRFPRRGPQQCPPLACRLPPGRRGRTGKLTLSQEKIVRRWLADNPTNHGFPNELWTADRLALLIDEEWGISF